MTKAPSPWNRHSRRNVDTDTPLDYGTDAPTVALSPQKAEPANLPGSGSQALRVGAVLLAVIVVVLLIGLAASAWVLWGPK